MKKSFIYVLASGLLLASACSKNETKSKDIFEPKEIEGYTLQLCDFNVVSKEVTNYKKTLPQDAYFYDLEDVLFVYGYLQLQNGSNNYNIIVDSILFNDIANNYPKNDDAVIKVAKKVTCADDTTYEFVQKNIKLQLNTAIPCHDTISVIQNTEGIYLPKLYMYCLNEEEIFITYTFFDKCGNNYADNKSDIFDEAGKTIGQNYSDYVKGIFNMKDTTDNVREKVLYYTNCSYLLYNHIQRVENQNNQQFCHSFYSSVSENFNISNKNDFENLFIKYPYTLDDFETTNIDGKDFQTYLNDLRKILQIK